MTNGTLKRLIAAGIGVGVLATFFAGSNNLLLRRDRAVYSERTSEWKSKWEAERSRRDAMNQAIISRLADIEVRVNEVVAAHRKGEASR